MEKTRQNKDAASVSVTRGGAIHFSITQICFDLTFCVSSGHTRTWNQKPALTWAPRAEPQTEGLEVVPARTSVFRGAGELPQRYDALTWPSQEETPGLSLATGSLPGFRFCFPDLPCSRAAPGPGWPLSWPRYLGRKGGELVLLTTQSPPQNTLVRSGRCTLGGSRCLIC